MTRSPQHLIRTRMERRLAALEEAEHTTPITFSIVGVQKGATSTVFRMLARHRLIAAGPEKEMRHFMNEKQDWSAPDLSDYRRPARHPRQRVAGDATPEYVFWPHALERMAAYDASMPIIASFRDPIERAFSQWSMERSRDVDFPDLPVTIEEWASAELPAEIPAGLSPYEYRRRSLYVRGLYGQQLERGYRSFPREQWLSLDFREVTGKPEATLDRLTDHLGLPRFKAYPEALHRNQTPTVNTGASPTVEHIEALVRTFADDLRLFAELSGIDVTGWPTARAAAGELDLREFRDRLVGKLGLPL